MVTQTSDGRIEFRFFRPRARKVAIAGDFNGWQKSFLMTKRRDGWWRSQISLAPGTYEFRYFADGQWFTDFAAFGVSPGPHGWNSVIEIVSPAPTDETGPDWLRPGPRAPRRRPPSQAHRLPVHPPKPVRASTSDSCRSVALTG